VAREHLTDEIALLEVACQEGDATSLEKIAISGVPDEVQVVLPLSDGPEGRRVELDERAQRLFILFPLLTTEHLGLPAVVNSRRFWPHEDRDGIVLESGNKRGAQNRELLERAAALMLRTLAYGAEEGWLGLERLVAYDSTKLPDWVEADWWRSYLRALVNATRRLPLVRTPDGTCVAPADSWVPFDDGAEHRERLWQLAASWDGGSGHVPQQDATHTWFENLQKWAELKLEGGLPETFTISRLAELVSSSATVEDVSASLGERREAFSWMRELLELIHATEKTALLDEMNLLPSQTGMLRKRSEVLRDAGVADDLKDIAATFEVDLRAELFDVRAMTPELGSLLQAKNEDSALEEALAALRRAITDGRLPLRFAAANASLFWWIAGAASHQEHLDAFPIVTADESDGLVFVRELQHDRDRAPLAPPACWLASARRFASLFPQRSVLHPVVADAVPNLTKSHWSPLVDRGFVRLSPLFETQRKLDIFLAENGIGDLDDDATHESVAEVAVSDLAFLGEKDSGLIDTARKSRRRAVDVLEFLTSFVVVEDDDAFDEISVACECGKEHRAFRAAWLIPLRERKWLPMGEGRTAFVTAESLASVVAEREELIQHFGSDRGAELLRALGVSPADFQLRALASDEDQRATLVRSMADLTRVAGGVDRLELLAREIRDHPEHIETSGPRIAARRLSRTSASVGWSKTSSSKSCGRGD